MTARPSRTPSWLPTIDELVATGRLVRWWPIVAIAAAATAVAWRARLEGQTADVLVAAAIGASAAGVLGDRAAATLAASPTTLARRASTRLLLVIPVVVASWLVAGRTVRSFATAATADGAPRFAGWPAVVLLATFVVGSIAIDATTDRTGATEGIAGGAAALVLAAVALRLQARVNPFPVEVQIRWWWGAVAGFTLVLALGLADPGRPAVSRRRRSPVAPGTTRS